MVHVLWATHKAVIRQAMPSVVKRSLPPYKMAQGIDENHRQGEVRHELEPSDREETLLFVRQTISKFNMTNLCMLEPYKDTQEMRCNRTSSRRRPRKKLRRRPLPCAIKDKGLASGGFYQNEGMQAVYFALVNSLDKTPDPREKGSHAPEAAPRRDLLGGRGGRTGRHVSSSSRHSTIESSASTRFQRNASKKFVRKRYTSGTYTRTRNAVAHSPESRKADDAPWKRTMSITDLVVVGKAPGNS